MDFYRFHTTYFTKAGFILTLALFFCVSASAIDLKNNKKSKFELQSINLVQKAIDVRKSDESLFFSLKAYSIQGLNQVIVYFKSPSGNETLKAVCVNKKKTKIGMLLGRLLFKKKSENGEWKIDKVVVEDLEGNCFTYDQKFLSENKFSHSLMIFSKK